MRPQRVGLTEEESAVALEVDDLTVRQRELNAGCGPRPPSERAPFGASDLQLRIVGEVEEVQYLRLGSELFDDDGVLVEEIVQLHDQPLPGNRAASGAARHPDARLAQFLRVRRRERHALRRLRFKLVGGHQALDRLGQVTSGLPKIAEQAGGERRVATDRQRLDAGVDVRRPGRRPAGTRTEVDQAVVLLREAPAFTELTRHAADARSENRRSNSGAGRQGCRAARPASRRPRARHTG